MAEINDAQREQITQIISDCTAECSGDERRTLKAVRERMLAAGFTILQLGDLQPDVRKIVKDAAGKGRRSKTKPAETTDAATPAE